MRRKPAITAALAAALCLSACATGPGNKPAAQSTPTASIAQDSPGSDEGHDHGVEEHYGVPDVTWDPAAETAVKDTASTVMGLFARPDVPEAAWYSQLAPYLAPEYAEDAKYIDPARVPIRSVTDGPAITREAGNPLTATATFSTDAGNWQILLHRSGQQQPWLVTAISPHNPA